MNLFLICVPWRKILNSQYRTCSEGDTLNAIPLKDTGYLIPLIYTSVLNLAAEKHHLFLIQGDLFVLNLAAKEHHLFLVSGNRNTITALQSLILKLH